MDPEIIVLGTSFEEQKPCSGRRRLADWQERSRRSRSHNHIIELCHVQSRSLPQDFSFMGRDAERNGVLSCAYITHKNLVVSISTVEPPHRIFP